MLDLFPSLSDAGEDCLLRVAGHRSWIPVQSFPGRPFARRLEKVLDIVANTGWEIGVCAHRAYMGNQGSYNNGVYGA